MPRAPRCLRDASAPDGLARDEHGNMRGGLRFPWMDIPDAQYTGIIHEKNLLEGGMKPVSEETMRQRHGSLAAYDAKIEEHLRQMAQRRWILERDIPLMQMRGSSAALYLGFYETVV